MLRYSYPPGQSLASAGPRVDVDLFTNLGVKVKSGLLALIDTGSNVSVLSTALAPDAARHLQRSLNKFGGAQVHTAGSAIPTTAETYLAGLKVSEFAPIIQLEVVLLPIDQPLQVILGTDFLQWADMNYSGRLEHFDLDV